MATVSPALNPKLMAFIRRQKMFFVATAPLSAEGSVNLSPKGYDSLAILDDQAAGPNSLRDAKREYFYGAWLRLATETTQSRPTGTARAVGSSSEHALWTAAGSPSTTNWAPIHRAQSTESRG